MGVVTTTITRPPRMSTLRNFSRAQLLPEAELEGALALRLGVHDHVGEQPTRQEPHLARAAATNCFLA